MRTRTLNRHEQLDKFTTTWLANYHMAGKTIYCRENCSGCCHLAVHATYPEAVNVVEFLTETQSKNLSGYIERLKKALPGLTGLKSYLKSHRRELGPCPFLDAHGSCTIYSIRPLSCRALLSTRPAAWCTVDFSKLNRWDKQAYESGLDRQIVAWPTHYVAATQDFGRELENTLLESMLREKSWSLSGNFALLVWLEKNYGLSRDNIATIQQVRDILTASELNNYLLLNLAGETTAAE
ncbi:MAG: YkgJ family cysteine cluster protein [Desulfuromonadales bacterium]|nr:YkgJ family cysteine cluster protein [Desulfuromonadales bacterium]